MFSATRIPKSCRHTCPEGSRCCLRSDIDHTLHICGVETCRCHSRARYDQERERQARMRELHASLLEMGAGR